MAKSIWTINIPAIFVNWTNGSETDSDTVAINVLL